MEMKQFLECAQGQSDITLCQGFNEALKQCKMYYQATSKSFRNFRLIFFCPIRYCVPQLKQVLIKEDKDFICLIRTYWDLNLISAWNNKMG